MSAPPCRAAPALALLALLSIGASSTPDVAAPGPCVACEVPVANLREIFQSPELERLRAGEIVVLEESREGAETEGHGRTRASALVPREPSAVWETLTDFGSWPDFMPLIDGTEVERRKGDQVWVRQRYSVMFVGMRHTSVYDLAPRAGELRWSLDEEEPADIEASRGRWRLVPVDGGRSTLVRYEAAVSAGRAVPGFVQDLLMRRSLRRMLESLREETERRHPSAEDGDE